MDEHNAALGGKQSAQRNRGCQRKAVALGVTPAHFEIFRLRKLFVFGPVAGRNVRCGDNDTGVHAAMQNQNGFRLPALWRGITGFGGSSGAAPAQSGQQHQHSDKRNQPHSDPISLVIIVRASQNHLVINYISRL